MKIIQILKREKREVSGQYAQYDKGFNHALGIAMDLIANGEKSVYWVDDDE